MQHHYFVQGVTCDSCKKSLREAWLMVDSITDIQFITNNEVMITMDLHVVLPVLQDAIAALSKYSISDVPFSVLPSGIVVYRPLFVVFMLIGLVTLFYGWLRSVAGWEWMMVFMGWWFVVFAALKLFNLSKFVEGYKNYDIVASHWGWYAWLYPFIELGLGLAFLVGFVPLLANIVTLVVMIISTIGVWKALGRKVQCVCIGTWFSLPLTKVTVIENLVMAGMALLMIFM